MKERPYVSIVTPAFNQGEYLADTIDSVLAQDYPHVEYIVLDDGSTDDTPKVLERYTGKVRWERHANMGQAQTLNRGWAMSRGEIIGYLSSDDLIGRRAVSEAVEALTAHPDAPACYCDFELIDGHGRHIRQVQAEDFDRKRLEEDLVCQPGPGAFFRKDVFAATGGWNPNLRQVPDYEFWLRVAQHGSFVRIPKSLASFRIHEGSASFRPITPERADEIVDVMRAYWGDRDTPASRRSLSRAFVSASRHHAQSGRFLDAFRSMESAIAADLWTVLSPSAWHLVLSGVLRRSYYHLRLLGRS